MLTLYTDAELDALIAQIKTALLDLLAGGLRVRVGDSEFEKSNIPDLEALGTRLAREKANRAGGGSRVTVCRPRRDDAWRRG